MKQDDLAAALAHLLEPTTTELSEEDRIVPYWAMSPRTGHEPPASPLGADFARDLARFLSEGFATEANSPAPSLADIAAYVDGRLGGAEREAFESALVASPELRAEVDMLFDRVAAFGSDIDDGFEPASRISAPAGGTRFEP